MFTFSPVLAFRHTNTPHLMQTTDFLFSPWLNKKLNGVGGNRNMEETVQTRYVSNQNRSINFPDKLNSLRKFVYSKLNHHPFTSGDSSTTYKKINGLHGRFAEWKVKRTIINPRRYSATPRYSTFYGLNLLGNEFVVQIYFPSQVSLDRSQHFLFLT